MKTSLSHPLQIQTVGPKNTTGMIGMTLCPGRKGEAASGLWNRDLQLDLEAIRAWKPDMVVALLEEHEFAKLGVPDFREIVRAAGLPWEFAAIRDGGIPGDEFVLAWEELRPKAHRILRSGGRVLIHCKAGLGRTGTLAALLLIDFGDAPVEAMARVRAARPNTIEPPQVPYVKAYRPAYSGSFSDALVYASEAHSTQYRKSTTIPYIAHLMAVSSIVLQAGGNEIEAIAALLHDVAEDQPLPEGGGIARLADVRARFGGGVASIVESLSDYVSASGDENEDTSPYRYHKALYHARLRAEKNPSVLLVSAADKLHNIRSMEADFDVVGEALWRRFNGSIDDIFWNYQNLVEAYESAAPDKRRVIIVNELSNTLARLRSKSLTPARTRDEA